MTDLDVVIVNWNGGDLLRDCLPGLPPRTARSASR